MSTATPAEGFYSKLEIALLAAIAAALLTYIVNYVVAPRVRRCNLTRKLKVQLRERQGAHARCVAINDGYWTVSRAVLYLSLDITINDVLDPPKNHGAFITPESFVPLEDGQMCWSVRAPTTNPMVVDLLAKEKQFFSPCAVSNDWIMIASEEGWEFRKNEQGHSVRRVRVFLRPRVYHGVLKIVSADTDGKFFTVVIDPNLPNLLAIKEVQRPARPAQQGAQPDRNVPGELARG